MGCANSAGASDPPKKMDGRTVCGKHLSSVDDLVDWPFFPPGQDKSLLAKYLTKEVWDEYKDKAD